VFQVFTIPGGQVFQWWASKLPSENKDDVRTAESEDKTSMIDEKHPGK
jgi:hypothetical protein